MGTRRAARERTVQFLFQYDLNPADDLSAALEGFWRSQSAAAREGTRRGDAAAENPELSGQETEVRVFADPLIHGVLEHRETIDELICKHVKNWELRRIATVDRNVLRLAIYEMLHRSDIPPVVSINEAVDIAKRFSTEESGRFVNGILDRIKQDILRPARIVP